MATPDLFSKKIRAKSNTSNTKGKISSSYQDLYTPASMAAATPSIRQFLGIRKKYPDNYLLFYRMGDFYELFFHDAERAAASLGIALTQRGQHLGQPIKMCGVPLVSAEGYLQRLIAAGFRVVICDQLEQAKGQALVERGVVRLVTPGTITEESLLSSSANHFLACLDKSKSNCLSLAWTDISTGEITTYEASINEIHYALGRIRAEEIILPQRLLEDEALVKQCNLRGDFVTPLPSDQFSYSQSLHRVLDHYKIPDLDIFGAFSKGETIVAGVLINYIASTQVKHVSRLQPIKRHTDQKTMMLGIEALESLDIISHGKRPSLVTYADRCQTPMGHRLVRKWLLHPSLERQVIEERFDLIAFLQESRIENTLSEALKKVPDGERATMRLLLRRTNPRDLATLRLMLDAAKKIKFSLEKISDTLPALGRTLLDELDPCEPLGQTLHAALADELPTHIRQGHFIARGFSASLDSWRNKGHECNRQRERLARQYQEDTGIDRLTIQRNNLIGSYVEIPQRFAAQIPDSFLHKQSTTHNHRYHTEELNKIDDAFNQAHDYALALEQEIFFQILEEIEKHQQTIQRMGRVLATLDVLVGWAKLSLAEQLCRPVISEDIVLEFHTARHPVVAQQLSKEGESFIANDLFLDHDRPVMLLTGPNMAGKSTFLRQAALLCILAQSGCYVPAAKAKLGLVDKIMTRIGAADDISHGKSTFMVEMMETAAILHQASQRSLLILDELGRGTSTYDGLSLAWAILCYLREKIGCRVLFSTHYRELTHFAQDVDGIENYFMQCQVLDDSIHFLHSIKAGASDHSYGHHVARLAGIPQMIIEQARSLQITLENHDSSQPLPQAHDTKKREADDLRQIETLRQQLLDVQPDTLTPRQALDLLYDLHRNLKEEQLDHLSS